MDPATDGSGQDRQRRPIQPHGGHRRDRPTEGAGNLLQSLPATWRDAAAAVAGRQTDATG